LFLRLDTVYVPAHTARTPESAWRHPDKCPELRDNCQGCSVTLPCKRDRSNAEKGWSGSGISRQAETARKFPSAGHLRNSPIPLRRTA